MSEILTNQKKYPFNPPPRVIPDLFLFNGLTVPQTLDGMYHRHMFTTTKQPLDALERAPHHRYDGLLVNGDEVDRLGAAGHSDTEQFSPQRPGTPAHVDTATPVPESAPLLLVQPTHTVLTHRQQLFQSDVVPVRGDGHQRCGHEEPRRGGSLGPQDLHGETITTPSEARAL
jgi:hypothetical protein